VRFILNTRRKWLAKHRSWHFNLQHSSFWKSYETHRVCAIGPLPETKVRLAEHLSGGLNVAG
jgi:hypothetical protein